MKCQNNVYWPKNQVTRNFISTIDKCNKVKIEGIHFMFKWKVDKDCPFAHICKYYEERVENE